MRRPHRLLATALPLALSTSACDGGKAEAPAKIRNAQVASTAAQKQAEEAAEAKAKAERAEQLAAAGDPSQAVTRPTRECKKAGPDSACCDHEFGIDPEAVAKACGYTAYLGEHRTFGTCQYRFDAGRDKPAAITLALFEDADLADSIAYHMSGFFGLANPDEVPKFGQQGKVHYSGHGKLAWAWLDGWDTPRRVAWSQKECSQDKLEPVFAAAVDAPEFKPVVPRVARVDKARPLPPASGGGAGEKGSLLERYKDRELTAVENMELPTKSMRLVVMLLERVAKDTTQDFDKIFTEDARRGLPDRRKLRSRSLLGNDLGYTFLTDFRAAAQRFGHDAKFACPPLTPSDTKLVQVGEAPMWCTYMSADKKDLIVISMVTEGGEAKIDYVGFLEEAPDGPLRADGEPPPPPVRVSDAERANKRVETMKAEGKLPGGAPGASPARPAPPRPQPAPKPAG